MWSTCLRLATGEKTIAPGNRTMPIACSCDWIQEEGWWHFHGQRGLCSYIHSSMVQGQSSAPISALEGQAGVGLEECRDKDRRHYEDTTPPSYHHAIRSSPPFRDRRSLWSAPSLRCRSLARGVLGSVAESALPPAGAGAADVPFVYLQSRQPECMAPIYGA